MLADNLPLCSIITESVQGDVTGVEIRLKRSILKKPIPISFIILKGHHHERSKNRFHLLTTILPKLYDHYHLKKLQPPEASIYNCVCAIGTWGGIQSEELVARDMITIKWSRISWRKWSVFTDNVRQLRKPLLVVIAQPIRNKVPVLKLTKWTGRALSRRLYFTVKY